LGFCLGPVFFVPNALAFDTKASPDFQKFLNALEWKAKNYGWDDLGLRNIPWEYYRKSVHNYPLMFVKFGNSSKNCVLFFGGIHGDELPSVYLMLQLAHYIQDNPDFSKTSVSLSHHWSIRTDFYRQHPPEPMQAMSISTVTFQHGTGKLPPSNNGRPEAQTTAISQVTNRPLNEKYFFRWL